MFFPRNGERLGTCFHCTGRLIVCHQRRGRGDQGKEKCGTKNRRFQHVFSLFQFRFVVARLFGRGEFSGDSPIDLCTLYPAHTQKNLTSKEVSYKTTFAVPASRAL